VGCCAGIAICNPCEITCSGVGGGGGSCPTSGCDVPFCCPSVGSPTPGCAAPGLLGGPTEVPTPVDPTSGTAACPYYDTYTQSGDCPANNDTSNTGQASGSVPSGATVDDNTMVPGTGSTVGELKALGYTDGDISALMNEASKISPQNIPLTNGAGHQATGSSGGASGGGSSGGGLSAGKPQQQPQTNANNGLLGLISKLGASLSQAASAAVVQSKAVLGQAQQKTGLGTTGGDFTILLIVFLLLGAGLLLSRKEE
jgi:hypothetical protein